MTHIKSVHIQAADLDPGHKAFQTLSDLVLGPHALAVARNAKNFKEALEMYQKEVQKIITACSWQYNGKPIQGCADERFKPELFRGPLPEKKDAKLEIGAIYQRGSDYVLAEEGKVATLGAMIPINNQGGVFTYMRDQSLAQQRLNVLNEGPITLQLIQLPYSAFDGVKGLTPGCFWPPMFKDAVSKPQPEDEEDCGCGGKKKKKASQSS